MENYVWRGRIMFMAMDLYVGMALFSIGIWLKQYIYAFRRILYDNTQVKNNSYKFFKTISNRNIYILNLSIRNIHYNLSHIGSVDDGWIWPNANIYTTKISCRLICGWQASNWTGSYGDGIYQIEFHFDDIDIFHINMYITSKYNICEQ